VVPLLLGADSYRSVFSATRALSSKLAGCCRSMGHMDGRLTIYIDPASHTLLAVSISSSYFIASAQICLSANA